MVQARKSESEVSTFPVRRRGAEPRPCFKTQVCPRRCSLARPLLATDADGIVDRMDGATYHGGRAGAGEPCPSWPAARRTGGRPCPRWSDGPGRRRGLGGRRRLKKAGRDGLRWKQVESDARDGGSVGRSVESPRARGCPYTPRPTRRRPRPCASASTRLSVCLSVDRYNNSQEPIVCPPDKNKAQKTT